MMLRRFDQATVLREFAKRVRKMRFRDAASYVEELDQLAKDMEGQADQAVRNGEPTPESIFLSGVGKSAGGRPFRAETRSRAAAA